MPFVLILQVLGFVLALLGAFNVGGEQPRSWRLLSAAVACLLLADIVGHGAR